MNISKNENGKWVIDFTCKGRRITRVVGENRKQAEEAMALIKADILRERYGFIRPKNQIPFEEFADEFLKLYSKQNKRSWRRDEISLDNLKSFFKGKRLSEIGPEMIEAYKARRKETVKQHQKEGGRETISVATVNRELACLKTLFSKAVEWGKADGNPARRVKLFRETNTKERILSDKEMRALVEASSAHLKPILITALSTGMRKSEILGLRWRDVDLARHFILIEDSKSKKSRKVPLNPLRGRGAARPRQARGACVFQR
jgi:integrase